MRPAAQAGAGQLVHPRGRRTGQIRRTYRCNGKSPRPAPTAAPTAAVPKLPRRASPYTASSDCLLHCDLPADCNCSPTESRNSRSDTPYTGHGKDSNAFIVPRRGFTAGNRIGWHCHRSHLQGNRNHKPMHRLRELAVGGDLNSKCCVNELPRTGDWLKEDVVNSCCGWRWRSMSLVIRRRGRASVEDASSQE